MVSEIKTTERTVAMRRPSHRRSAFSLLEVLGALALLGLMLVPTAQWMATLAKQSRALHNRGELVNLVRGKQNQQCQLVRGSFEETKERGSFKDQGYPELAFESYCLQDPSQGGIPDLLMSIRTLGWHDSDGNGRCESNETQVDLWTTVARATP